MVNGAGGSIPSLEDGSYGLAWSYIAQLASVVELRGALTVSFAFGPPHTMRDLSVYSLSLKRHTGCPLVLPAIGTSHATPSVKVNCQNFLIGGASTNLTENLLLWGKYL